MGAPMASSLAATAVAAGDRVLVWNRTPGHARSAVDNGAERCAEAAELAARSEVVIAMLPDLVQLEELVFGPAHLLAAVTRRTVLVVCSSVSPSGVREFADRVAEASDGLVGVVDAPVSGGPEGARAASLAIMAGGSADDVAAAWPALSAMGGLVRHLGPIGAGSLAKVCNQMVVAATMIALSEATALAEAAGLNTEGLLDVLGAGYASSRLLEVKRGNLIDRDYAPAGLARYMVKDLGFAAAESAPLQAELAQTELSRSLFTQLTAAGWGDEDMSVVHRIVRARCGLTTPE